MLILVFARTLQLYARSGVRMGAGMLLTRTQAKPADVKKTIKNC